MKIYKADLYEHLNFSYKPTYWVLRKFKCPESFTTPKFIYTTEKKIGNDFARISALLTRHRALTLQAKSVQSIPVTTLSFARCALGTI